MRKRCNASAKYVVFHDILVPLEWSATKERAFALIMQQCGYAPVWRESERGTLLQFRLGNTSHLAAKSFTHDHRFGAPATRDMLMVEVFAARLQGWRALTSDRFAIEHSIAERTIHTVYNRPRWHHETG
jgi:hypothetical protein